MNSHVSVSRASIMAIVGLVAGFSTLAAAQSQSALGPIADNDSIFVDGKTFEVIKGRAKGDASGRIKALGARELGPGAIIYRSGETLYVLDAPLLLQGSRTSDGRNMYVGAEAEFPDRIRIEYAPAQNLDQQKVYDLVKEHRVLETLQKLLSPFRFPAEVTIKTLGCNGMINSWYNTDDSVPTVHMCYELLQDVLQNVPKETTPAGITPSDAVVGQFLFWTLHEFGHAVFDIYQVPLFASEEDSADRFAVYIMLQFGKDQARRLIGGAAYAANEFIKNRDLNSNVEKTLQKYSSVHGLPEQRLFNLLCLAYGADPKLFADVVEKEYLPKRRAGNCEYEYQSFARAFRNEIVGPHLDKKMAESVLDTAWLPPPAAAQPRSR